MALKDLKYAAELLRGGMSPAEISRIVALQDDAPENQQPEKTDAPEGTGQQDAADDQPQAETDAGKESKAAVQPEKTAEQKKPENPYRAPAENKNAENIVDELNKLF